MLFIDRIACHTDCIITIIDYRIDPYNLQAFTTIAAAAMTAAAAPAPAPPPPAAAALAPAPAPPTAATAAPAPAAVSIPGRLF